MVNDRTSLNGLVWPDEAYARSTNLELHNRDPQGIPDYKFTAKSLRLLEDILDGSVGSRRERAWSVVGPYGSGKSTFGLFVLQLLAGSNSDWLQRCLAKLQISSLPLETRVQTEVITRNARYLPIVLQGSRLSLDVAFCKALYKSATDSTGDAAWASASFRSSLGLTLELLEAGVGDSKRVADHYEQAARLAKIAGYEGLLVVVDEFGKFLERAAWQGDLPDLVAAQYIAELASGLQDSRILFLVLLHQGFQHYASSLSQKQWLEWAKIQGRFRQVDFNEDPENLYDLIAGSLTQSTRDSQSRVEKWSQAVWRQVQGLPVFQAESQQRLWKHLLPKVYPFHPLALYALPRLSARLGQNERTLFTFIASNDPLGLKAFLKSTQRGAKTLPSLTLDFLFDYFVAGSKFALLPPDVQRRIGEIEAALDRLGDRPAMETRIIKTLGILSLLRTNSKIIASEDTLAASLQADDDSERQELRESLDKLLSRKLVVFRKYSGEYRLWQGSDFDFDTAIAKAKDEIQREQLTTLINHDFPSRPLVARRHSIERGTLRFFATKFFFSDNANPLRPETFSEFVEASRSDGVLGYLLPKSIQELRQLREVAVAVTDPRIILVLPTEPLSISTLVHDLAALGRVQGGWPEMQDDPVALKELSARAEAVEDLLREGLELFTEPQVGVASWFWRGAEHAVVDRKDVNQLLSKVCDEVYPKSPKVRNELVNRRTLSSAIVVAVKKIVEGLLSDAGKPMLGFEGNGPEVSIFRSVFVKPGIYRADRQGRYFIGAPSDDDPAMKGLWGSIEAFLLGSETGRAQLTDLHRTLSAPPFGTREGLLPLLIWGVLISHRRDVCLYENGTYIREWSPEVFDRYLKAPNAFSVRRLVVGGYFGNLIKRLSAGIPNATEMSPRPEGASVSSFLGNLYRWYQSLPDYAKHTQRLSRPALDVRRILVSAVDPAEMLSVKFPEALGILDFKAESGPRTRGLYAQRFLSSILEIHSAYTVLCNDVVAAVATEFSTTPTLLDVRTFFQGLTPGVLEHVRDSSAKAFLVRARDKQVADLNWIESIGAVLTSQSPKFWLDHHMEEFLDKLALVGLALSDARRRDYARNHSDGTAARLVIEMGNNLVVEEIISQQGGAELDDSARTLIKSLKSSTPSGSPDKLRSILVRAIQLSLEDSKHKGGPQ